MLFQELQSTLLDPRFQKFFFIPFQTFENFLQRAEFFNQFGRRFFADSRNADDVVRRIALQPFEIRKIFRSKPVALFDFRLIIQNRVLKPFPESVDANTRARDELERIQVPRSDDDFQIFFIPHRVHYGTEHIIGLKLGVLKNRDGKRFHQIVGTADLRSEVGSELGALGFVFLIGGMPESGLGKIVAGGDIIRLQFAKNFH